MQIRSLIVCSGEQVTLQVYDVLHLPHSVKTNASEFSK